MPLWNPPKTDRIFTGAPIGGPYFNPASGAYGPAGPYRSFTPGGGQGGQSDGASRSGNPLNDLMEKQIALTTQALQTSYAKLYGDLYGQLQQENNAESSALTQLGWAEKQAMQQLAADYASRGMTRSGAYLKAVADQQLQLEQQRQAVLNQYATAHAEIAARLGVPEGTVYDAETGQLIDPEGNLVATFTQDGGWVMEADQSGLYAEYLAELAQKKGEIELQYGIAQLPSS
jgi:hypothetical protein